jgi:flagellar biosynthesis/type III secretory pathway M-ring protein FliF/YscJ
MDSKYVNRFNSEVNNNDVNVNNKDEQQNAQVENENKKTFWQKNRKGMIGGAAAVGVITAAYFGGRYLVRKLWKKGQGQEQKKDGFEDPTKTEKK